MRAVIVGAGLIAKQHLRALTERRLAEVVGVCDLSPALAASAAERFRIPAWFTDSAEMLRATKPDVVHVTTPPSSHFVLARQAIESGAHAIVEKPFTLTLDQTFQLLDLAESLHRHVIEDYNYLFSATVQRLLGLCQRGELGQVVHVDVRIHLDLMGEGSPFIDPNVPHWVRRMPGSIVADFATHLAYLARAFAGPHRSVQTLYRRNSLDSPLPADEFRALIDGGNCTAELSLSCHAQPDLFAVRVWGTRGNAEAQLFEPRFLWERLRGPKPLIAARNGLSLGFQSWSGAFKSVWRKLSGGPGSYDGLWELLRQTYESLKQPGASLPVCHSDIREVNALVHELLQQGPPPEAIT
jgi:predicted dehydrogenase